MKGFVRQNWFLFFLFIIFVVRLVYVCGFDFISCDPAEEFVGFHLGRAGETLNVTAKKFRQNTAANIRRFFPSPHSELLLGVTIGLNDLNRVPRFSDVVRQVGTIHVVVVSGYNISLVFAMVFGLVGSLYRLRNFILALSITLFYAIVAGFDPPVVRAWVMGALALLAKYYGRRIPILQTFSFSALLMLAINPSYLYDLSFQLSFLATFGLVYYSEFFEQVVKSKNIIAEDLKATLSAQIFVWPVISYYFEQVSVISPLVNALTLWTIPLATMVGGGFLFIAFVSDFAAGLLSFVLIAPLDIFVRVCYWFARFSGGVVSFKPGVAFLIIYYVLVLMFPRVVNYKKVKSAVE